MQFSNDRNLNEMTDLYLQMLIEAQKVEDKKLIKLIARRIRQTTPALATFVTESGCEIIPFPFSPVVPVYQDQTSKFWSQLEFWGSLSVTLGIVSGGLSVMMLFLMAAV